MRAVTILLCFLATATLALAEEPPAKAPAPAPTPAMAAAPMASSIKIVFDDKAKTDGELRLDFTPAGGTAKQIRVTIAKKMDAKDVARDVEKELKVALGDGYDVDRYDADKIKVEAKKKGTFSLTLASLTATGLSVRFK